MSEPPSEGTVLASRAERAMTMIVGILLVLYWLTLFTATHTPIPQGVIPRGSDKLLHFAAYAGLAVLLLGLRATRGRFGWRSVVARGAVLAAYGAFDEVTQLLVGRQADVADWYADVLGAACGLMAVVLLLRVLSRRKQAAGFHRAADEAA